MAYCESAVPVYGSDKLPRLTYSIAPQFGNRGSSRSDVKTQPCRRFNKSLMPKHHEFDDTRNREPNTSYLKRPRDNTH